MVTDKNLINNSFSSKALVEEALKKASETQPWPCHFKLRAQECRLLFDFFKIGKFGRMLEIGCENAFGSVHFSEKAIDEMKRVLKKNGIVKPSP